MPSESENHNPGEPGHTFLILPHDIAKSGSVLGRTDFDGLQVVSELWLEKCMLTKSFVSPENYTLGRLIEGGLTSLNGLIVNATGFDVIETKHISTIVPLLGGTYSEVFTAAVSVLVCRDGGAKKDKIELARHWNIPAVTGQWLWSTIDSQSRTGFEDFLLHRPQNRLIYGERAALQRPAHKAFVEEGTVLVQAEQEQSEDLGISAIKNRKPVAAEKLKNKSNGAVSVHQEPTDDGLGADQEPPKDAEHATSCGRSEKQEGSYLMGGRPLREVSPTSARRNGRPVERGNSAIRTMDGASNTEDPTWKENIPGRTTHTAKFADIESINGQIREILSERSKNSAAGNRAADEPQKKNKLMGRALSNLSNSSSASNIRKSRASSIDSMNTDGIGSEIRPMQLGEKHSGEAISTNERSNFSFFTGRARSSLSGMKAAPFGMDDPDLVRAGELRHEQDAPPQMTQLGYEDPEEAILLREKLAASRKKRSQKGGGPKEGEDDAESSKPATRSKVAERKIRDDDLFVNADADWGAGRRTRHKQRSPPGQGIKQF